MVSCSRCESFGCSGAIVALLQKRCHAPAKFGEVGEVSLAPEEFIAELLFQLFDGTRERGLCDIALLDDAQRRGKEIIRQARRGPPGRPPAANPDPDEEKPIRFREDWDDGAQDRPQYTQPIFLK